MKLQKKAIHRYNISNNFLVDLSSCLIIIAINLTLHNTMPDSWLANYSSCMQLYQDIIEQINERNIEARATANISNMNALIKKDLLNLKRMLAKLKLDLQNSIKLNLYTNGELDRRQSLLDTLTTKVRNANETVDFVSTSPRSEIYAIEREELFSTSSRKRNSSSGGNPWLEKEERAAALKSEQIRRQQALIPKEQDQNEGFHSNVRKRQTKIGINSGSELNSVDADEFASNNPDNQLKNENSHCEKIDYSPKSFSTFSKILSFIFCGLSCWLSGKV